MSNRSSVPAEGSLEARLAEAEKRIEELEALADAEGLLDPTLDFPRLALHALELSLRVVPADAALLVAHDGEGFTSNYLLRGERRMLQLGEWPSRLAEEVLKSGEEGIRTSPDSPGARAVGEVLGAVPRVRVAVPLRRAGKVLGVLEVAYREEPAARFLEASPALASVAEHLAVALDNARLVRAHARRARELTHLYSVGQKISSHLELEDTLAAIVDSVRELIPADAVGIFLLDEETGALRNATIRGYDASLSDIRVKAGGGIIGWAAKTGQGVVVPDVTRSDRYIAVRPETRAEMAAPIRYGDRVIGIFNLESDRESAFTESHLALLTNFGNQAAISIVNARLHAEVTDKRLLEQQLEIARGIQASLVAREAPRIPGHVLGGRAMPSQAVGGDYFDFVRLSGDRWAIVVADVSGHGIPAGLVMAGFRAGIRAILRHHDEPADVLDEANRTLCGELAPDYFVTAFLGVYSPDSGKLVYSNGGHEPGLLVRESEVEHLTEGGLLLGVFAEAEYRQSMVHLAPGDRLLLYTDGLSDGADPWGDRLGPEGVVRLLHEVEAAGASPVDVPERVLERATEEAAGPADESDDRTLVVLRRDPREKASARQEARREAVCAG